LLRIKAEVLEIHTCKDDVCLGRFQISASTEHLWGGDALSLEPWSRRYALNGLNGAKRLIDWNNLNGHRY
jgi:hypothetical protein